jgi:hypothetical protein
VAHWRRGIDTVVDELDEGLFCAWQAERASVVGLQPTFCPALGRAHGGATVKPVPVESNATRRTLARVDVQRPSS